MSRPLALTRGVVSRPGPAAEFPLRAPLVWRDPNGWVLAVGACLTGGLAGLEWLDPAGSGQLIEAINPLAASVCAVLVLLVCGQRPRQQQVLRYKPLAASLAVATLGIVLLDLGPRLGVALTALGPNLFFLVSMAIAMPVIVPALYRHLDRAAAVSAALDGAIMLAACATSLLIVAREPVPGLGGILLPLLVATFVASACMAVIAALAMRAALTFRGIWCGILSITVLGLAWSIWIDQLAHGELRVGPVAIMYSLGVLGLAYAWSSWNDDLGGGRLYESIARSLSDWLPIAAILLCVVLTAIPHHKLAGYDLAPLGTLVVVFLTISRQRVLVGNERHASRRLAGEVEDRAQTMLSLARLERAPTLQQTADRICEEGLRLDGIDAVGIYVFDPSDEVVPLALAGASWLDETRGEPLPLKRALRMRALSVDGPWIDSASITGFTGPMLVEALAPLRWSDRVVGVVSMGATHRDDAIRLAERLPTLTEFSVVTGAMLGPMLIENWRLSDIRSELETVIDEHAFEAVFQPIVGIRTREVVGYEALTRFSDGERPDKRFVEADTVGMSIRLETACVAEQLESASWLPQGTWVSLNVSPTLAAAVVPLISALERADREVVIEITEHVEIEDYRKLVAALELVRPCCKLAVDDAGAGYAGLRHILELNPHYVKLDLSLVRNIDGDPARQAMVAGMAHFARHSGCELIAEGIETQAELDTLDRLGIGLGQGYLFGKPAPLSD